MGAAILYLRLSFPRFGVCNFRFFCSTGVRDGAFATTDLIKVCQ